MKHNNEPFCTCLYEMEKNLQSTRRCMMACQDQRKILNRRGALEWWGNLKDSDKETLSTEYNISNPTEDEMVEMCIKERRKSLKK